MNIKAVILDLDGTILHNDKSVSDYTIAVLARCKEKGIMIAVATARSEAAAQRYLAKIKPDAVISNGGALLRVHGITVYESVMPAVTADALVAELLRLPGYVEITVQTQNGYYVSWDTPSHGDYAASLCHDFRKPLSEAVYKITVHLESEVGLREVANRYLGCSMIPFSDSHWYRFASRHATKMQAIERLAEHCGFTVAETVAFGDDFNDEEMLRKCGIGVAMDNAVAVVKEAAYDICESNDNDGVARWLEENVLRRECE